MARESAIKAIHETMFGLQGKLIFLQEQYSVYHDNYSAEAMELLGVAEAYNKAVSAAYENKEFDNLSDSELDEMVDLSRQVSQLYELGVDFSATDTVVVNDDSFWKIYKNKDNAIIRVEYGQNAAYVQIINQKGQIEKTVQRRTDLGGFSRSLLEAAGEEDYNNAKKIEMIETIMLDDGLFYVEEKGWIEKQKYYDEKITAKDFLSIQDYKDITVKAVYDDSKGELTFTYTAGGKTENLFVIKASNNQMNREFPTKSGKNVDEVRADISNPVPYIPEKFPKGNWKIIAFEKQAEKNSKGERINSEYGPYKIRTDAFRYVEAWDYVFDEDLDTKIWKKRLDENGNVIKVKDSGLLIHGGGWSESSLDNQKGSNKYTDTTLGCIRISNLDVCLIVETLQSYLNKKGSIPLEVK
jgi:hypothetical protein